MENKNISVLIMRIAKAGMESYLIRYLKKMVASSREDKGCIIYNIHQSKENPLGFMVYMLWESKEAFEAHNNRPEMQEFRKKLAYELFDIKTPKSYWHLIN